MNIQKINFLTTANYNNRLETHPLKSSPNSIKQFSYNPVAYRDFNVNFGDRLFRSPENFFEQDFNRENMPSTMRNYLFGNYEDRQHIPPAQMMEIVFDDIKKANTLEEVKELYFPDEELFQNLHSMSDKNYRESILAEINVMKEPDKTLFKDGNDDLGMYILKKIYLESKTLKEINKDFKEDISNHYKGLSDIKYTDLANFGIRFPKQAFWHSLYSNRENFPFVSVKKGDSVYHANGNGNGKPGSIADINSGNYVDKGKEKPKYTPNERDINRMTDAIMAGAGSKDKTEKELKNRVGSNNPNLQFIQKYFGEIMSITLEKVHASEDMCDFFENYEKNDSSKSKNKMQQYWNTTPKMKALMGLVMSDTIKLFFLAYGADGKNEYFQGLLDYAHSIKPAREARKQRHNELQEEYEIALGITGSDEADDGEKEVPPDNPVEEDNQLNPADGQNEDEDAWKKAYTHTLEFEGTTLRFMDSLENLTKGYCTLEMGDMLPKNYLNKYIEFLKQSPKADTKLLLSMLLNDTERIQHGATQEFMEKLYTPEETTEKLDEIQYEFMQKNFQMTKAIHQALITTIINKHGFDEKSRNGLISLYRLNPFHIASTRDVSQKDKAELTDEINKYYNIYKDPISNKDANKATIVITDILRTYDKNASYLKRIPGTETELKLIDIIALCTNGSNKAKNYLKDKLLTYLTTQYGGSAKVLLDSAQSRELKTAAAEEIIISMVIKNNVFLKEIVDKYGDDNINNPEKIQQLGQFLSNNGSELGLYHHLHNI